MQGQKIVAKETTYNKKINRISIRHNPKTVRKILVSMVLTKENKHNLMQIKAQFKALSQRRGSQCLLITLMISSVRKNNAILMLV